MAHQIRVKIGGMEYAIMTDDDEAYIKALCNQLEDRMDVLIKKSPFLSTTMVAVTAALEAYDDKNKKAAEIEKLKLELKRAQEEAALAKLNAEAACQKLSEFKKEHNCEED